MRRALLLVLWTAAGCGAGGGAEEPGRLYRVEGGAIRLRTGEALYLRGINLSNTSKYIEGHLYPLEDADLEVLAGGGFDSVRLLTFWEAVMPAGPGLVDPAYLAGLAAQVRRLAAAGLWVVVDMHQDLYGSPFSPGAPPWSCPEEVRAGYEPAEPWWANYTSRQVMGCFDRFWATPALWDELAAAWAAVAGAVCAEERVLGFDLLNEPWPASALGDPGFDNGPLLALYLRLAQAIEAACPGRLVFLEPSLGESLGLMEPLAPPPPLADHTVLAPHFYPREVHDPGGVYAGDRAALAEALDLRLGPLGAGGLPLWIGEWGGMPVNENFATYLEDAGALYADRFAGSALYEYSAADGGFAFLDAAGRRKPAYDALVRTPMPALLPERPTRFAPDFARGTLALELGCVQGRRLEIRWPDGAPGACQALPAGRLSAFAREGRREEARCEQDGTVSVVCGP
ncbi:MAG TPA: cellulase family glycosylhydrolase [Myxococcota bacterium]|nr:cellulase family glycosylhydrolase [Myxococcota bacterium]HRY94208.1 cellulase family glycosylhydrolase [Myxococcota bacterium]HSA20106.1 cellulase family glycosylhydrolase [Myxococcota bacterium]